MGRRIAFERFGTEMAKPVNLMAKGEKKKTKDLKR